MYSIAAKKVAKKADRSLENGRMALWRETKTVEIDNLCNAIKTLFPYECFKDTIWNDTFKCVFDEKLTQYLTIDNFCTFLKHTGKSFINILQLKKV